MYLKLNCYLSFRNIHILEVVRIYKDYKQCTRVIQTLVYGIDHTLMCLALFNKTCLCVYVF